MLRFAHRVILGGAIGLALSMSGCRREHVSAARAPVPDTRLGMGKSTDVLYVLDGHVLARASADSAGMPSAVRTLDPARIESIRVLKGAKARKEYGEAGASGVVVITTKRG
jgi:TonB-dependent SusC/RagA subfamily outer membrane receptor